MRRPPPQLPSFVQFLAVTPCEPVQHSVSQITRHSVGEQDEHAEPAQPVAPVKCFPFAAHPRRWSACEAHRTQSDSDYGGL
jgi:hypothetical protein